MSRSDDSTPAADVTAKPTKVPTGMQIRFSCLGCGKARNPAGSRGQGIKRRCAQCVQRQAGAKGAAP